MLLLVFLQCLKKLAVTISWSSTKMTLILSQKILGGGKCGAKLFAGGSMSPLAPLLLRPPDFCSV